MIPSDESNVGERLRELPSVDTVLATVAAREAALRFGPGYALDVVRRAIDEVRSEVVSGSFSEGGETLTDIVGRRVEQMITDAERSRLRRIINATGVIIHTNLGRAPLSDAARQAIASVAGGYCTLEYDLSAGRRGRRGASAEDLLCRLTGAEDALIVNNCAAAALLVLTALSADHEVIVSRGELVEIGGDFRVPDVMARSGCTLREVGTTNRTKLADYEAAIGERTAMLMRVHPSNYRIVGFTQTPGNRELARLASTSGLISFEDAGSGALVDLDQLGLGDEPVISRSIDDGIDLVAFSGDKLLGGPQAGIVVGRRTMVERLRSHPLYRALRADKLAYAALEATLSSYARGTHFEEIPVLRMLSMNAEEISERTRAFNDGLSEDLASDGPLLREVVEGHSAVGGGAAPATQPLTRLLALTSNKASASAIEEKLRLSSPSVIARIEDDRVLLDLRTVAPAEEAELAHVIKSVASELAAG